MGPKSPGKASAAISKIKTESLEADVHFMKMDLPSVVKAAEEFKSRENRLNGLVNNPGIMATSFAKSPVDGFEAQWQTNY